MHINHGLIIGKLIQSLLNRSLKMYRLNLKHGMDNNKMFFFKYNYIVYD